MLGARNGKARSWLGFFDKCRSAYLAAKTIPLLVLRIVGYGTRRRQQRARTLSRS